MAQLAINGHATRGKEVIEILEMLGGKYEDVYKGTDANGVYIINEEGFIDWDYPCDKYKVFTLEEYFEKFPYKVGDKVQQTISCGSVYVIEQMKWEDNQVKYVICDLYWKNCKCTVMSKDLQPYKEEIMESKPNLLQQLKEYFDNTPRDVIEKEWHEYDKYNEIGHTVNEYLEYVNKSRQPQYPKTYEECAKIMNCPIAGPSGWLFNFDANIKDKYYRKIDILMGKFTRLLICRDAYRKIAGEQMGLGKPWKPDFTNNDEERYSIYTSANKVEKYFCGVGDVNTILSFPTEEMRDAFYENFKELITICKELL